MFVFSICLVFLNGIGFDALSLYVIVWYGPNGPTVQYQYIVKETKNSQCYSYIYTYLYLVVLLRVPT